MFYDIESNEIVTIDQLKNEYDMLRQEQPDEYNYSFEEYIRNCKTENNGTLEDYPVPFC